jgi:dihydrofolate reductase
MMRISIIVAMAVNRVIGREGGIPWKIPGEQKLFKQITLGHCILMGRKTYESIRQRPLPQRTNIVVTRQTAYRAPGCHVVGSLPEAFRACPAGEEEAFICGGGQLYHEALPQTDRIYLSILPRIVEGDTYFPEWPADDFSLTSAETIIGPQPYHFLVYDRDDR